MTSSPKSRSSRWAALLLTVAATAAAQEPVELCVADVVGEPGGDITIVLRSLRPKQIGQGQVDLRARNLGGELAFAAQTPTVEVFAADGIGSAVLDELTQTTTITFSSATAAINTVEGPIVAVTYTLADDIEPGSAFDLQLDPDATEVLDGEGDPIEIEECPGELDVELDPGLELEIEGGEFEPGATAVFGVETETPFALESGTIVLLYDPAIAADGASPVVTMDERYGLSEFSTDVSVAGRIEVAFTSSDDSLNATLPGLFLQVSLATNPALSPELESNVSFDGEATFVFGPDATPLDVQLKDDEIEFDHDEELFDEGFEEGDESHWWEISG